MSRATRMPASAGSRPADAPPPVLRTDDDLRLACDRLLEFDPALMGPLLASVGHPPLRQRPPGFAGLAAIVVAQMVSTASAEAIFSRLAAAFDPLTATAIQAADPAKLRACGLSGAKIRTLQAAAAAVRDGALNFDRLRASTAEAAHAELVAVPGIGPWTADIVLLFCLGHADAWPAGDLALQEALRVLLGLAERPDARSLVGLAERWRPYRGVAAHLLWAFYRIRRTAAP